MSGKILGPVGVAEVTGGFIASEAVTNAKIANATIAAGKQVRPTVPTFGAVEGETKPGATGLPQMITGSLFASNSKGPFTFLHNMGREPVVVQAYNKTKKESWAIEKLVSKAGNNESEVTFTVAPAAKDELFVSFLG